MIRTLEMIIARWGLRGLLLLAALGGKTSAQEQPPTGYTVDDRAIDESSGLAASRSFPGCWWTHNDSGDRARLFLLEKLPATDPAASSAGALPPANTEPLRSLEAERGLLRARAVEIPGAEAEDWEDMCSARIDGQNVLWIGDIGDNGSRREHVVIYRVEEPSPSQEPGATSDLRLKLARQWRVRYEDGPRDCEGLAFDPVRKEMLLVAKTRLPFAGVYRIAAEDLQNPQRSEAIVAMRIGTVPIPMVTAIDIRDDGLQLAVCTYFNRCLYQRRPEESWQEALQRAPQVSKLPPLKQIEAIAYDLQGRLWVTSERAPMPLQRVDDAEANNEQQPAHEK